MKISYFFFLFYLFHFYFNNSLAFYNIKKENRDIINYGIFLGMGIYSSRIIFDISRYSATKMIGLMKKFFLKNDISLITKKIKNNASITKISEISKIENKKIDYRYLSYDPSNVIIWEDVILDDQIKKDLLSHAECYFSQYNTNDILTAPIICLYGLPGMNKTDIIKGLAQKLNIPLIVIDPLLLDVNERKNLTIESLIKYTELKNSPCILHIKNIEKMNEEFIIGSFLKALQFGFKSNQKILLTFSCNNDFLIKNLWINKNSNIKFIVLYRPNLKERKAIILNLLKKYQSKIDISLIDIDYLASFFDKFTNEDIRIVLEKAIEKKIHYMINNNLFLNHSEQKSLFILNNQDVINEYSEFVKNNAVVNNSENHLNKGLYRIDQFFVDRPKIKFDDVIGLDHIKEKLKFIISFLKNSDYYKNLDIRIPKGILFKGAPGCGKTLMAKALAGESNVSIIVVSGSDFIKKYVGEGAHKIREMFEMAKIWAPTIIFIDEIDAISMKRGGSEDSGEKEYSQTLNELLTQMDGFSSFSNNIIVIGSTNRDIDSLDEAILRRFEDKFHFRLPIYSERIAILKLYMKNILLDNKLSLESLAGQTTGFSSAEIEYLVNEIKLVAMERIKKENDSVLELIIKQSDVFEAYNNFCLGYKIKNYTVLERQLWKTAIHEIGHSLCMLYKQGYFCKEDNTFTINKNNILNALYNDKKNTDLSNDDFLQVTVIPRDVGDGIILGMASSILTYDFYSNSSQDLHKQIIVCLGGLVAEEIIFGDTYDGVSADLKQASHLARIMVTSFGMSNLLYNSNNLDKLSANQNEAIENILRINKVACKDFLMSMKNLLLYLAQKLQDKKTLSKCEIMQEISNFYHLEQ